MRIERLELLAYGSFQNRILDFGPDPGFHLVTGANEAGKTTTLRALSSVLFGYPHKVEDGYLFESHDIRLGIALLDQEGTPLSFRRSRGRRGALTLSDGSPLDDAVLSAFLGSLTRESFEMIFSLSHERLRAHSQELLAEGGALGLGLAGAGSGISTLRSTLDDLRRKRGEIYLSGGSKPRLNQRLSSLAQIKKEIRERSVSPLTYKSHLKEIQELEERKIAAYESQDRLDRERRTAERILRTLPEKQALEVLESRLADLSDVVMLPDDAESRRIAAQSTQNEARGTRDTLLETLERLKEERQALGEPPEILAHAEEIQALVKASGAVDKSREQLPRREKEREMLQDDARKLLLQAGLAGSPEELSHLLPLQSRITSLATHLTRGATLSGALETATNQEREARLAQAEAREALEEIPETPDFSRLESTLGEGDRFASLSPQIERQRRLCRSQLGDLGERLRSLGFSAGELDRLRTLPLPDAARIRRMKEEIDRSESDLRKLDAEGQRLEREEAETAQRIRQIARGGKVATLPDLERARGERDSLWKDLREDLTAPHKEAKRRLLPPDQQVLRADSFEELSQKADHLSDLLRTHAERSAELGMHNDTLETIRVKKETIEGQRKKAQDELANLERAWATLWPDDLVSFDDDNRPTRSPESMLEWLSRRTEALALARTWEEETAELALLEKKEQEAARTLLALLAEHEGEPLPPAGSKRNGPAKTNKEGSDPGPSLEELRQRAQRTLKGYRESKGRRERAETALRSALRESKQAADRVADLEKKIAVWKETLKSSLREDSLPPSDDPVAVQTLLEILGKLATLRDRIQEKGEQIAKMKNDHQDFAREVARLSRLLPEVPGDPLRAAALLEESLREAQKDHTKRQSLERQVEDKKTELSRAESSLRKCESLLAALCQEANCDDLSTLPRLEAQSKEKGRIMREAREVEARILAQGGGLSREALFLECEGQTEEGLQSQLARIDREKQELAPSLERTVAELTTAKQRLEDLVGGPQAGELVQKGAFLRAGIGEEVESYLSLTLEELLLRRAIELYQDRNQGPILNRAGEIFSRITRERYLGIRADLDDKGTPLLLAVDRTQRSLEVSALSDGTRDALYLALRLAAIDRHNEAFEPVPFVADDLLINFDNDRATATLEVLSDYARKGQVLFLTHHAHLGNLAKSAVKSDLLKEHML